MLDLDLSDPVNQVRALVGDVDGSYISDTNISFLLTKHSGVVIKAATEALEYILALVSFYASEESGDVKVEWQQIYNQLKERSGILKKDSLYASSGALFVFGGTTRSEIDRVNNDPESRGVRRTGFSTVLESYGIDPDNPYYLISRI